MNRGERNVERAGFEQSLHGIAENLRAGIVDVGFEHRYRSGFFRAAALANQDAQHVGVFGEIVIARAVSARDHAHRRQGAEVNGERGCDGGARRSGQFQAGAARIDRLAGEQFGGGGSGNRQNAMFGFHCPAADVYRRTVHRPDVEQVQADAGADDVADGIHRAHFVEMDLFDRNVVNFGFGLAQALKHSGSILFGAIRDAGFRDDFQNMLQMAVSLAVTAICV